MLYLAPSIEAALAHLLDQIWLIKAEDPLAPVILLAPSSTTIRAIQRRLGDTLNVRIFQFYGLGQLSLDAANRPAQWVSDVTLRQLIQVCLQEMFDQGSLSSFVSVWQKPGFQQIMLDWLREMKSQGITPDQVRQQAERSGLGRDQQLAGLYEHYQGFLVKHGYSDSDGLLWLAAEALEADARLLRNAGFFAALGFDQFTPVQLRILAALSRRLEEFRIYLPWDARRPEGSLTHTRLARTRRSLEAVLQAQTISLEEIASLPAALDWLRKSIFEPGQILEESGAEPTVRLIAAPSREAEVRWALREMKKLLQSGASPDELALLAPNPGVYRRLVQAVAAEYGLPFQIEAGLIESPVIAALANLLSLAPEFSWRQTLDALRSPYISQHWLSLEQVEQLDRLSRERPVVSGVDQWRFCLQPAAQSPEEAEDDDLGSPGLAALLGEEALQSIREGLLAFFTHLTPPPQASYREYSLWIQETILGLYDEPQADTEEEAQSVHPPSLGMLGRCQVNSKDPGKVTRRDLAALGQLTQCLRCLLEAAELVQQNEDKIVPWEFFRSELLRLLSGATISPDADQPGLRFLPLESGRALPLDHLFVLGLAEGDFPSPLPPDPLYSPSERAADPLPIERREPGEAASLWWQVIGAPRRSLTLIRPRLDESGAIWLPSPYYSAAWTALPGLQETSIPIAEIPPVEESASPAELLVALAAGNAVQVPPELEQPWQAARAAQHVLSARESWQDIPAYEGFLGAPDLLAELANHFHPGYLWSSTAINTFAKCPYLFFSEKVIKLEKLPDPEAGFDIMQRGRLLHAILEALFRGLMEDELSPCLSSQEVMLERLETACQAIFEKAPEKLGFRPGSLWRYEQAELRRMLHALMEWECEQNGEAPQFRPFCQELRFGIGRSSYPPQPIASPAGTFLLHGVIDRIDRDEHGRLRVIDYKSGSSKISEPDVKKCLAVQTSLYALAAQQIFSKQGLQVEESVFLHLPNHELSGQVSCPEGPAEHPIIQESAQRAFELTRQVIRGVFPADPSKPGEGSRACSTTCDFGPLCRIDRHAIKKAHKRGDHGSDTEAE